MDEYNMNWLDENPSKRKVNFGLHSSYYSLFKVTWAYTSVTNIFTEAKEKFPGGGTSGLGYGLWIVSKVNKGWTTETDMDFFPNKCWGRENKLNCAPISAAMSQRFREEGARKRVRIWAQSGKWENTENGFESCLGECGQSSCVC